MDSSDDSKIVTVEEIKGLATTDGKLNSPIDLNISNMRIIELEPLQWHNYHVPPKKLKMTNTGYTVLLSAKWQNERPYLTSGPLTGNYVFSQVHFHWGKDAMNGSEHYIDGGSMPMELHVVHYKSDYLTQDVAVRKEDGVIILVYLFKEKPNPFLSEVIKSFPLIESAYSSVRLVPFVLTNIFGIFKQDYFVYWGSIVTVEYTHTVLWIVSREPIGISMEQIAEFRTLHDENKMPILENRRPLQNRQNRQVFYVCPSGSRYASLLPIRRQFSLTGISNVDTEN